MLYPQTASGKDGKEIVLVLSMIFLVIAGIAAMTITIATVESKNHGSTNGPNPTIHYQVSQLKRGDLIRTSAHKIYFVRAGGRSEIFVAECVECPARMITAQNLAKEIAFTTDVISFASMNWNGAMAQWAYQKPPQEKSSK